MNQPPIREAETLISEFLAGEKLAPAELRRGFIYNPASKNFGRVLQAFHRQGVEITPDEFGRIFNQLAAEDARDAQSPALKELKALVLKARKAAATALPEGQDDSVTATHAQPRRRTKHR